MVSSTFTDLKNHRAALIKAIHAYKLHANVIENDSARLINVIDSSLEKVEESMAYIGVVSLKYGQTPECRTRNPGKLSITELEFTKAHNLGLPILLFVMHDGHGVKKADIETDPEKETKLNAFRERAKKALRGSSVDRVYAEFQSLGQFKEKIAPSLAELSQFLKPSAGAAPQNEASPTKSLRNLNPVEKATKDFERRKIDVVCLGEAVVDFAIYGQAWKNFLKKYANTDRPAPIYVSAGGSPFIVAQVIRNKLGGTSEFIGRVGNDHFGQFLNESPSRGDSDFLRKLEKSRTRLILSSVPDGSHNFEYITHPAADGLLEATYVNDHCAEPIKNCSILHFGGMVLKSQSLADAAKAAVKMALDANCSISLDVTFRKHLWVEKVEKFVDAVRKAKAYKSAHILKFTLEELRLFFSWPWP